MKIIVCIKQVPGTSNVQVDPKTGILKREGIECKLNPYDLFALETALRIRERKGGTVTAISMGPAQAYEVLLEALYIGVDNGFLLSDRRFAGSDVIATSYTLSQGIGCIGEFDLVICGKQTTDGDTAQVGPETAEFLGIPHSTNITEIIDIMDNELVVKMNMDTIVQEQKIKLPCLITVDKDICTPRLPSYKRKVLFKGKLPIETLTLDDFSDRDPLKYGLNGSPTQVERIFPPDVKAGKRIVEESPKALSEELVRILNEYRLI